MNGRQFARQRALILASGRSPSVQARALDRLVQESRATVVFVHGKRVGYRLPDGFMVCEKRRYPDQAHAQGELEGIGLFMPLNTRRRLPIRAYHCEYCQGWHLTGQYKKSA